MQSILFPRAAVRRNKKLFKVFIRKQYEKRIAGAKNSKTHWPCRGRAGRGGLLQAD